MAKVRPGPCISFVRACRGSRCRVGPSKTSALLGGRRRCADSPPSRTRSPGLSGASAGHCVSRAYRLAHDITALELAPCQLPVGLKDGRDGLTKALAALLKALVLGIGPRQLLDVTDPPLPISLEDGREGSRDRVSDVGGRFWHGHALAEGRRLPDVRNEPKELRRVHLQSFCQLNQRTVARLPDLAGLQPHDARWRDLGPPSQLLLSDAGPLAVEAYRLANVFHNLLPWS